MDYLAEPFEPGLRGYLPEQRTDPYTSRILSLLRHAPYSSPSGSLMDSEYLIIITDIGLFVKRETGYFCKIRPFPLVSAAVGLCLDISPILL